MNTNRSQVLFEKSRKFVPGGVHSNFRVPIYFEKGCGSKLWDIDGNEYIDCIVSNGACILGHGDEDVDAAVISAVKQGLSAGLESELSMKASRLLQHMVPSAEQVRFANSGSEAVMKALMIARAYTAREKIIKIEGGYHGWFDEAQVSVHPEPAIAGSDENPTPVLSTKGIRRNSLDSVLVVPFNNLDAIERSLVENKDQVAAVLIEPVMFNSGCIIPQYGYLEGVRRLAREYDILLIFDEVITGFRLAPGGAQERFGVTPDMSVFAKAIANGYPLAAVVGRKDIMEVSRPGGQVIYGGTYDGQHVAVAAACICLEKLKDGSVQKRLEGITQRLTEQFTNMAKERGISAQLLECGGQFQIYFTDRDITDYRTALSSDSAKYKIFHRTLLDEGLWFYGGYLFHHGVSSAHSEEDVRKIIDAFGKGLDAIKNKN